MVVLLVFYTVACLLSVLVPYGTASPAPFAVAPVKGNALAVRDAPKWPGSVAATTANPTQQPPPASTNSSAPPGGGGTRSCSSYTLIETRGTGEAQGPSMIFRSFDGTITQKISGLKLYQTVYPADMQQDMQPGVANIVSKISTTLKTEPKACFFLQGFSQGAGVNTIFMSKTTGAVADAVIGVLNLGNSMHVANFAANIDDDGGTKSRTCMGPEQKKTPAAVPATWAPKVIDICARTDSVCCSCCPGNTPGAISMGHGSYPSLPHVWEMAAAFFVKQAQAGGTLPSRPQP